MRIRDTLCRRTFCRRPTGGRNESKTHNDRTNPPEKLHACRRATRTTDEPATIKNAARSPSDKKFFPVTGVVAPGTTAVEVGDAIANPGSLVMETTAFPLVTEALETTKGLPVEGNSITLELDVIELDVMDTKIGAANVAVNGCPVDGLTTSTPTPAPNE
jgi:hypothetical protein